MYFGRVVEAMDSLIFSAFDDTAKGLEPGEKTFKRYADTSSESMHLLHDFYPEMQITT